MNAHLPDPSTPLPDWMHTGRTYIALHTKAPTSSEQAAESNSYARVSVGAPADWSGPVRHRAVFTAPAGGDRVTHAAFRLADGKTQWLDLTTEPPTPCDPPPGWTDVDPAAEDV